MKSWSWWCCLVGGAWLVGSAAVHAADLPAPRREFRAAWIATVANIDWPSKPGLPADRQRAELVTLLDRAADTGLNAVILQVRPCADALYDSPLEPWSEYLSGTMGEPPDPPYDPLAFAVAEAHARGLELHCWFNPYRVRHSDAAGPVASTHASVSLPGVVRRYGKFLWFDPGEPVAADRFIEVVRDVVRRYDVDGVHIDDYFYPYPVKEEGRELPFPDADSHARAMATGGLADRAAWRRDNVDRLVERLWREVKERKPHVLVGISPFGIWRPGHPPGIKGLDQVAALNADPRKWLREGWLDYLAPQLYWRIDAPAQGYLQLLAWWADENIRGRGLWPGNYTSRIRQDPTAATTANVWEAEEILRQVEATRARGRMRSRRWCRRSVLRRARRRAAQRSTETAGVWPSLQLTARRRGSGWFAAAAVISGGLRCFPGEQNDTTSHRQPTRLPYRSSPATVARARSRGWSWRLRERCRDATSGVPRPLVVGAEPLLRRGGTAGCGDFPHHRDVQAARRSQS
jgi:uncharacterized lipoprotein YddW (UPF0748 family)